MDSADLPITQAAGRVALAGAPPPALAGVADRYAAVGPFVHLDFLLRPATTTRTPYLAPLCPGLAFGGQSLFSPRQPSGSGNSHAAQLLLRSESRAGFISPLAGRAS